MVENRTSFGFAVSLIGFLIAMQVSENFPAHSFSAQFSKNVANGMNDRDDDAQENPSKKIHFTSGLHAKDEKCVVFARENEKRSKLLRNNSFSAPERIFSPPQIVKTYLEENSKSAGEK